jgi:hypothetical protein
MCPCCATLGCMCSAGRCCCNTPSGNRRRWSAPRSLEQLRVLEHGYKIRMVYFPQPSIAVDTETDLQRVRTILSSAGSM